MSALVRVSAGAETVNMFGRLEKVYESTKRQPTYRRGIGDVSHKAFQRWRVPVGISRARRSDYPYDGPVVIPKEFRGLFHGHVASIFALGLVVLPLCPETKGQPLPA